MWLIKTSLKNPYAIAVMALLILVLGLVSIGGIPVDILPVFKAPAVQVMTYFSGMPTSSVEKTITNRVERWTNQAAGCERAESKSTLGVSVVRLFFRDDIDPNGALTQANSLALGALPTLPPGTLPPVVLPFDPTGTLPLGILSVTSPTLSETELKDLARIDIRNMLGGVKGVVAPAVFGGKDRTILIYVDPEKLQARNLSPMDVVNALSRENFMVTPGVAKFGGYEFQLDTNAMVEAVTELNDIPIRMEEGNRVYLRDVGYAKDSHSIQTGLVRIDGHRQVYVPVYRQQGASSLTVVDGVKHEIPHMVEVLRSQGKDVKLALVMDQSIYVREAITSLIHEGVIGAVLVACMILIFLGNWRMTFFATLSIPLAILCAVIGLGSSGNTINAMTLGGLALAIGPLVDNAIVVLENTHRHQSLGKSSITAAFDGAMEVALPVLVATLATIIVLCPIALMPGMGGFLFRPLTLALAFAMIASFVLSQTLIPTLCGNFLKGHSHAGDEHVSQGIGKRIHHRIELVLHGLNRFYERLLNFALNHRTPILIGVGLLFLGSLTLVLGIGREFFPAVDAGQLSLMVRAPSGTNLEATEQRVSDVEHFLEKNIPAHERRMIISELGLVPDWSSAYTPNSGTQDAVIKVQLSDERSLTSQEYAVKLRRLFRDDPRFADLRVSFDTGGMVSAALNYGASSPLDVQIAGGDMTTAMALAQRTRDWVSSKAAGAVDVRILQRTDAQQRILKVDRQKAADEGLDMPAVVDQVATALNSSVAIKRVFWIDPKSGNQYFVAVQYAEDGERKLSDLLDIPITGKSGDHPVKLGSVATFEPGTAPVEINHVSLARVLDVMVNTEHKDIGSVAGKFDLRGLQQEEWRRVAKDGEKVVVPPPQPDGTLEFPDGIRVSLRGEYSRMNESFGNLGWGLALASFFVYLLLIVLFRSFVTPLIIMFAIPLGLIGVLGMLFLTHTRLNVQSSMGVIFMVGIVVANGVLLVDFANKQRKLGAGVRAAITTAASVRFRPILMTFLATFLDLLPMAIGLGKGSEANVPLARAVVGGLLSSTTLTLIVVPIMYTLMTRDSKKPAANVDDHLADSQFAASFGFLHPLSSVPARQGDAVPSAGPAIADPPLATHAEP